jgi:ATP-dependent helicase/nuclease subunit B
VPERCSSKLKESERAAAVLPVRRIYTVPPGRPFLTALAEALLAGNLPTPGGARPAPMQLADVTLLLPTRRATRALQEAFLAAGGGGAMLLPKIRPIIGSGEEPTLFAGALESAGGAGEAAPAIGEIERQLLLAVLVQRWADAERGGRGPEADIGEYRPTAARTPAQAARLARELARLMDAMEIEDVDYAKMRDLVPDTLAAHWETTLDFLRIVTERWPAVTGGRQSKMQRDKQQVLAQASQWRKTPPDAPVIVAGVMSSVPGRDGAVAGRGRPAQRRAGAAGAGPGPRRGELANDRAGASRASAVRPQETARCAGGAARGRAELLLPAPRRRRPSAGARAW